jgi:hypothetical protein
MEIPKRDYDRAVESSNLWRNRSNVLAKEIHKVNEQARFIKESRNNWQAKYQNLFEELELIKKKLEVQI